MHSNFTGAEDANHRLMRMRGKGRKLLKRGGFLPCRLELQGIITETPGTPPRSQQDRP